MINSRGISFIIILFATAGAFAQTPENPAPVQATAETSELTEIDPNIRDPFKPFRDFRPQADTGPKEVSVDPLQNIDLNSVTVLAILWDVSKPRALIKSGDKLFTIVKDAKIGRNGGVVAGIREGEVVVSESYEEDGKIFRNYISLKMAELKKKEEAAEAATTTQ
jgi:Tfp pilus assembly protein PilP